MIPDIGLMVGLYVITRMVDLVLPMTHMSSDAFAQALLSS
jgi:hypothetical protein